MDFSRQNEAKEIIIGTFNLRGDKWVEQQLNTVLDTGNSKGTDWFAEKVIEGYGFYYCGSVWIKETIKDLALVEMIEFLLGVKMQDEYERRLKEKFGSEIE